jgi:hypothetical protein
MSNIFGRRRDGGRRLILFLRRTGQFRHRSLFREKLALSHEPMLHVLACRPALLLPKVIGQQRDLIVGWLFWLKRLSHMISPFLERLPNSSRRASLKFV